MTKIVKKRLTHDNFKILLCVSADSVRVRYVYLYNIYQSLLHTERCSQLVFDILYYVRHDFIDFFGGKGAVIAYK